MGSDDGSPPQLSFPDLEILRAVLTSILRGDGALARQLIVLSRQPNIYSSTFDSEIVTCRFNDGGELQLLCKYGFGYADSGKIQRGVPYEVEVYQQVLRRLPCSTPRFFGSYQDEITGTTWLVLEYLDRSLRVNKIPNLDAMRVAARWLGQFHAAGEALLSATTFSFLNTYNVDYYQGLTRQTEMYASQLPYHFPWLGKLCESLAAYAAPLLAVRPAIIHGEFYPQNILFRDGIVYPVDWESAALAAGEIDLASLTQRWPSDLASQWSFEYRRARWPDGPPDDFDAVLGAARLYWSLRWLGDPEWTVHGNNQWYFEQLRTEGKRAGLL